MGRAPNSGRVALGAAVLVATLVVVEKRLISRPTGKNDTPSFNLHCLKFFGQLNKKLFVLFCHGVDFCVGYGPHGTRCSERVVVRCRIRFQSNTV